MVKKNIYTFLILGIAFMLVSFRVDNDPDSNLLRSLLNKLQNHYEWYPQQKAYLHTDKSDYNVDERIWFKAYLVDASTHRPDQMSTNLYVDLINPSGMVVQTRLLRMEEGMAHGDFSFQDTIPEGRYKIRAYTNWLRNLGKDFYFSKDLYISNPLFTTYATKTNVQRLKKECVKHGVTKKSTIYPFTLKEEVFLQESKMLLVLKPLMAWAWVFLWKVAL
ncbi:MAG: MG2 domain-containing protein [Bacteroidales bacterium]